MTNASCGTLYFYVADERSASPSCMNNCWLDISATTIEFESPISDVLEASHRSSGCLATSIVGSSVGLFGAWVKRARQPSDFTPLLEVRLGNPSICAVRLFELLARHWV